MRGAEGGGRSSRARPRHSLGDNMTNALTRRPTLVAAVAALVGASALLVVVGAGPASAGISWSAVNAPLPANAVAGQGLTLSSTACPADGWCVAVGDYLAQFGGTYYEAGLITTESGGTWSASQSPMPANAALDPQAFLQSVTCSAVGSCVAVGRYLDSSGATQGLVEQLSNGLWTPIESALPAGALIAGSNAYAQLSAVACPSAGSCTAAGLYSTSAGSEQAFVDTEVGGNWVPQAPALPVGATGSQFVALACPAVGSCVATGTDVIGGSQPGFAEVLSGGVWTAAVLPLPAGTSPMASIANNDLSVACPTTSTCVVAGTTFDGSYEGLLDTLSGGTWSASAAPTPAAVASTDVQLTSVACTDASDCTATGLVLVSGVEQGLLETLAAGTWSATAAPTPAGTPAGADIEVLDVACPAAGTCVADGQSDASGTVNPLFWNLSAGSWVATTAPLPGDAAAGSDATFSPFACPGAGVCLAVGTYIGSNGREGVVETDPSLAPSTTTVTVQSVSSTVLSYSAAVSSAAGSPTGTVVFSSGLTPLCSATVSNGTATCTGPIPPTKAILASYSGAPTIAASWGAGVSPAVPAAFFAVSPTMLTCKINSFIPGGDLRVMVTDNTGAGVPGLAVTFNLPTTGPLVVAWGPTTVLTNAYGVATSPFLSTNGKVGSYFVTARAYGVATIVPFILTNTKN